jgi:hypothetical protein
MRCRSGWPTRVRSEVPESSAAWPLRLATIDTSPPRADILSHTQYPGLPDDQQEAGRGPPGIPVWNSPVVIAVMNSSGQAS